MNKAGEASRIKDFEERINKKKRREEKITKTAGENKSREEIGEGRAGSTQEAGRVRQIFPKLIIIISLNI